MTDPIRRAFDSAMSTTASNVEGAQDYAGSLAGQPYRHKALTIPMSREMLAVYEAMPTMTDLITAIQSRPQLTPAEREAEIQRRSGEAQARHRAVVDHLDGLTRRLVEHHAPEPMEVMSGPYCLGCDGSAGYQDEGTAWPCSTFLMVEEETA